MSDIEHLVAELQDHGADGYTRLRATTEPANPHHDAHLVAMTVPPRRTLLDRLLGRRT